jgi:glycosyltransferase EpsF
MEKKQLKLESPKKVLQVVSALGNGGVESMLMNIYRNSNENVVFDFLVHTDDRKYSEEIKQFGGNIFQMDNMINTGVIKYIKTLSRVIKENGPYDAVHSHILFQNGFILLAAKLAGVKIRLSHSHLTNYQRGVTKIFSPFLRFIIYLTSNRRLACGQEAGKFLYGRMPFSVIPNAINTDLFLYSKGKREELVSLYGIDNNAIIIGNIGRLNIQKNHMFIIKIAKEMKERGINFCIFCVGDGPLENDINKKIHAEGLETNLILLGPRNDIPDLLKSFDVFLLPSLYEGLPVVLIEAQASGIKCVVSDTVTREADLGLSLLNFVSLDEDIDSWIDTIIDNNKVEEPGELQIRSMFINKNYDINSCTNEILKFYK